ncbi:amidohydrolase [Stigmatella aurantiaca]|uniref:Amidohydrolase n=1 Tax=Stigmatella aurantiaca (strain DW4/3-1) TaxID=378806 RepID=Q09ED1_STIAD|nr:amidohydrolase [Stigmatella aurantiaca]ADO74659.1 Amidohydrolase [Stigmatella aurantiaca DW4/3-1]EAU70024.1 amidohydrolase family protein [Stigmatella aurantiaca DW4/3-1]
MTEICIRDCHALVPNEQGGLGVARHQDILIQDNRIAALRPTGEPLASGVTVVEGQRMLALPGLINTHAHVASVLFRGLAEDVSLERWFNDFIWPLETHLTPEDVYWGAQLGLIEMIEAGVTTVADHSVFMDEVARAVEAAGTRARLGWSAFSSGGYAALAETAAFAERWKGGAGGRISTCMAPFSPYTCDDGLLRACVGHATRLGVGIHLHAAEEMNQTLASVSRRDRTPIQVLQDMGVLSVPTLIAHGCGLLPQDVELLARHRAHVGIAHAPKQALKLALGVAPLRALRKSGVPVGLATGTASGNTLELFESLRLMAMLQKHDALDPEVLPIPEALDIATRGSASALGLGTELGVLAPGALADIVLVDTRGTHWHPQHDLTAGLVYGARASDVHTVLVNGRVLLRDRQLLTLDKERVLAEVVGRMERLARRVPESRPRRYKP